MVYRKYEEKQRDFFHIRKKNVVGFYRMEIGQQMFQIDWKLKEIFQKIMKQENKKYKIKH